ncbi:Synaptotagmin-1 [Melipona quadrifasciata]|uniref:Synaptotagmin-1 n=1 Tax=Melipona quadrifasciata TaxID=166423 RepID=A0A0N0U5Q6_9HYME|nr:Synaptotagmin-1 [Melipona quadrifasciata]
MRNSVNICLMHLTLYSVSDSVNSKTGEDLSNEESRMIIVKCACTTTTLNSSEISDTKVAICFIRRSTELSAPVFNKVVIANVAMDLLESIARSDRRWMRHGNFIQGSDSGESQGWLLRSAKQLKDADSGVDEFYAIWLHNILAGRRISFKNSKRNPHVFDRHSNGFSLKSANIKSNPKRAFLLNRNDHTLTVRTVPLKQGEAKSVPTLRVKSKQNENVKLNDVSYRSWRLGSLYEGSSNGTIDEDASPIEGNSWNSNNVHFGCTDTSSTLNLVERGTADKQKQKDKKQWDFPTELTISLQYLPPCDETITGKLVIGIEKNDIHVLIKLTIALSGLPPKQYNCTLEPYVALNITKQSWSHRKREKLHSFRTRCVRHTASPVFKETFVVANVKPHEVKEWILDFAAYDRDRYANDTELSSFKVPLKEARHVLQSPEIHMFNFRMKPSNLEFGNILLAVSYLPTAQRLTINVMKVRDVKCTPTVSNLKDFSFYVRILMLHGRTGQRLKKKKTKFVAASSQPEFNETLTFDVSFNQLDIVQFLAILCSRAAPVEVAASSIEHPSDSEDSVTSAQKWKDISIGKVALGKGVRGSTERLHWFSVLQNPRKLVTVWHVLK